MKVLRVEVNEVDTVEINEVNSTNTQIRLTLRLRMRSMMPTKLTKLTRLMMPRRLTRLTRLTRSSSPGCLHSREGLCCASPVPGELCGKKYCIEPCGDRYCNNNLREKKKQ